MHWTTFRRFFTYAETETTSLIRFESHYIIRQCSHRKLLGMVDTKYGNTSEGVNPNLTGHCYKLVILHHLHRDSVKIRSLKSSGPWKTETRDLLRSTGQSSGWRDSEYLSRSSSSRLQRSTIGVYSKIGYGFSWTVCMCTHLLEYSPRRSSRLNSIDFVRCFVSTRWGITGRVQRLYTLLLLWSQQDPVMQKPYCLLTL